MMFGDEITERTKSGEGSIYPRAVPGRHESDRTCGDGEETCQEAQVDGKDDLPHSELRVLKGESQAKTMGNLRIYSGFLPLGTIAAAVLTFFTDRAIKGNEEPFSVGEIAEDIGASSPQVIDALKFLSSEGHLPETAWARQGTIAVGKIAFGVIPVQSSLSLDEDEGDKPKGKKKKGKSALEVLENQFQKDRTKGVDHVAVPGGHLRGLTQDTPDGIKFTMHHIDDQGVESLKHEEMYATDEVAWEFFDEYAKTMQEVDTETSNPTTNPVENFDVTINGRKVLVIYTKNVAEQTGTFEYDWESHEDDPEDVRSNSHITVKKFKISDIDKAKTVEAFVITKGEKFVPKYAAASPAPF